MKNYIAQTQHSNKTINTTVPRTPQTPAEKETNILPVFMGILVVLVILIALISIFIKRARRKKMDAAVVSSIDAPLATSSSQPPLE